MDGGGRNARYRRSDPALRGFVWMESITVVGLSFARISARDVEGAKAAPKRAATPAPAGRSAGPRGSAEPEKRPLSMMRKAIARRLTESKQTVPHFYLSIDVDADPLHTLREQVNADLAAMGDGAPVAKLPCNAS